MAKKVAGVVKLQLPAGKATPAPPVGPALGGYGINIMQFVKEYNEKTASQAGSVIPVEITIFEDRSFTFVIKTSPAADLIKKAAGITAGSGTPNKEKVGKISRAKIEEIAKTKMPDLNTTNLESAMRTIEGTARQMGLTVE